MQFGIFLGFSHGFQPRLAEDRLCGEGSIFFLSYVDAGEISKTSSTWIINAMQRVGGSEAASVHVHLLRKVI